MKPENGDAASEQSHEHLNGDLNVESFGRNLLILKSNDQIKELQTIIRDK